MRVLRCSSEVDDEEGGREGADDPRCDGVVGGEDCGSTALLCRLNGLLKHQERAKGKGKGKEGKGGREGGSQQKISLDYSLTFSLSHSLTVSLTYSQQQQRRTREGGRAWQLMSGGVGLAPGDGDGDAEQEARLRGTQLQAERGLGGLPFARVHS